MKKGLITALVLSMGAATPAFASDQHWACEVVLCMANPKGPLALKECEPSIKKAWKAWAKGKSVPSCKKQDAQGVDAGEITKAEGLIEASNADPVKNCPSQFTYYATRNKVKHCAFSGVTNQYINGQLWGRIWYGGPNGEPYVEQLVDDPKNPRPPETMPATFAPIKADLEAKSDLSLQLYKDWQVAQTAYYQQKQIADKAQQKSAAFAQELANLESWLPGQIENQKAQLASATAARDALYPAYFAAEKKVNGANPTQAEKDAFNVLYNQMVQHLSQIDQANQALSYAYQKQAQLPALREDANKLAEIAAYQQSLADQKAVVAAQAKSQADAAEYAAQPLPVYQ